MTPNLVNLIRISDGSFLIFHAISYTRSQNADSSNTILSVNRLFTQRLILVKNARLIRFFGINFRINISQNNCLKQTMTTTFAILTDFNL